MSVSGSPTMNYKDYRLVTAFRIESLYVIFLFWGHQIERINMNTRKMTNPKVELFVCSAWNMGLLYTVFAIESLKIKVPPLTSSNWNVKRHCQNNHQSNSRTFCLLYLEYDLLTVFPIEILWATLFLWRHQIQMFLKHQYHTRNKSNSRIFCLVYLE